MPDLSRYHKLLRDEMRIGMAQAVVTATCAYCRSAKQQANLPCRSCGATKNEDAGLAEEWKRFLPDMGTKGAH